MNFSSFLSESKRKVNLTGLLLNRIVSLAELDQLEFFVRIS